MKHREEYVVLYPFRDLQNKSKSSPNGRIYAVGDSYYNKSGTQKRIDELVGKDNKIGKKLIGLKRSKTEPEVEPNLIDYDKLTKPEIGEILAGKGIKHSLRDTRKELLALLGSD